MTDLELKKLVVRVAGRLLDRYHSGQEKEFMADLDHAVLILSSVNQLLRERLNDVSPNARI